MNPNRNSPGPFDGTALTQWILSKRGPRNILDPWKPYAFFQEIERNWKGVCQPCNTILLTNKECPWKCLMCDLWENTLDETVPFGAIPAQIEFALNQLPPAPQIKLYNAGSFFDPKAIPVKDYPAIAIFVKHYDRVIVESHPRLVGPRILDFQKLLSAKLELSLGLEIADDAALAKLNKKFTLRHFKDACAFLTANQIDIRVFIMIQPPGVTPQESDAWVLFSARFAFNCGADVVSLLPTRLTTGAGLTLARQGAAETPTLKLIEDVFAQTLELKAGRVFLDLWDLEKFSGCSECFSARKTRLEEMNYLQKVSSAPECFVCGANQK